MNNVASSHSAVRALVGHTCFHTKSPKMPRCGRKHQRNEKSSHCAQLGGENCKPAAPTAAILQLIENASL